MERAETAETVVNPLREGLARRKNPDPCTVVLFGASGDLTRRKLLPALYHLGREALLPAKIAIVGFARRKKSDQEFGGEMREALRDRQSGWQDHDPLWEEFSRSIFYHSAPFDSPDGYRSLKERLERIERDLGLPGNRLHYLAVDPAYFSTIAGFLGEVGLLAPPPAGARSRAPWSRVPWSRVVVEKPFGRDLESARALNRALREVLDESQIFRIDHYLGKETVQNLAALRFANGIFEPLLNEKFVDHVQITVAEELGVEGRGAYYDKAGALRDMVQNHMLQVLSLTAMEPPGSLDAGAIHDEKVKVLRAIRRIPPAEVDRFVVRGQYGPGVVQGRPVPGYAEEEGVSPGSRTETFVAIRLAIDSWRWAGVPFFLRTGKRLPKRASEICIQFKKPPLRLFGEAAGSVAPNALIINIQPDEGVSILFAAKVPGPDIQLRQVKMDFRYGAAFSGPSPEAYQRLLLDAMAGDSTLFTRSDEVEAAWTICTDLLKGWEASPRPPDLYPAGSWGPAEAERLFEGTSGSFRRL